MQAFTDESKRNGKFMAAVALIDPTELTKHRVALRALLLNGQSRLHFTSESDQRRRMILSTIAGMDVEIRVYDARHLHPRTARAATFDRIVADLGKAGVTWLIIEQDDNLIDSDVRTLHRARTVYGAAELDYAHKRSSAELLLCIPDAIAWCVSKTDAKGADWRRRASELVSSTTKIDP